MLFLFNIKNKTKNKCKCYFIFKCCSVIALCFELGLAAFILENKQSKRVRVRERERKREYNTYIKAYLSSLRSLQSCVLVCVFVCERERFPITMMLHLAQLTPINPLFLFVSHSLSSLPSLSLSFFFIHSHSTLICGLFYSQSQLHTSLLINKQINKQ